MPDYLKIKKFLEKEWKKILIYFFSFLFLIFSWDNFKLIINTSFLAHFIYYFFCLLTAVFVSDLWFYGLNKKYKKWMRDVARGSNCNVRQCNKYVDGCIGISENIECEKFDEFAPKLGWIERSFYFVILSAIGFDLNFFKIIGAWFTLKTVGNYWSAKDNGSKNEIVVHYKRANFLLFLTNNLISIGSVLLVYFAMQWSLNCFQECNQWCGKIKF